MSTPERVLTRGRGRQIPREKKKGSYCNPKETSLHWELLYPGRQTQNESDQAQLGLAHKSPWLRYISVAKQWTLSWTQKKITSWHLELRSLMMHTLLVLVEYIPVERVSGGWGQGAGWYALLPT